MRLPPPGGTRRRDQTRSSILAEKCQSGQTLRLDWYPAFSAFAAVLVARGFAAAFFLVIRERWAAAGLAFAAAFLRGAVAAFGAATGVLGVAAGSCSEIPASVLVLRIEAMS